ncbi:Crp/Fnr family transcriptional regulator [Noviherbaspirillum aridicola]|uniref:Transcriptional regulator n=1 Tax=Noviherbaspirillum aridicola TaxID=2849687 RepID=A0ABQ4Q494_9BURK|nr:Crp/Fnr family transcriptional regulator [Noviherbaspirillum aridicola]GIZ51574.1 transcriptional regulator [Noviherbaspirillum aridicola]
MPLPQLITLRAIPPLADLPEPELHDLLRVATWRSCMPGELIAAQNGESDAIAFLISGFVKSVRSGPHQLPPPGGVRPERRMRARPEVMVALLGPGDLVNESGVVRNTANSTSSLAVTPCQLIMLPREHFLSCMGRNAAFALAVARRISQRQVDAERRIELMRGNVEGRVRALLRECREIGLDAEKWLNNAEIARMVGATRVAVSPIMARASGGTRRAAVSG